MKLDGERRDDLVAAVLDTAGALIVVLDRNGAIVSFNHACRRDDRLLL